MNPHIELAKKWRADDTSVTLEELEANKKDAYAACDVADGLMRLHFGLFVLLSLTNSKMQNITKN